MTFPSGVPPIAGDCEFPSGRLITKPPDGLTFASMAELYAGFSRVLLGREFRCPRGTNIIIQNTHFFHLVKLSKGGITRFTADELREIEATTHGFGRYEINEKRAQTLSWIPEILTQPHEIWEYETKKTADEAFIREYDKAGSPFRVALLARENDYLRPVTCMSVRRTGIKEHRRGRLLWQKEKDYSG
jgi:hypothetical protein